MGLFTEGMKKIEAKLLGFKEQEEAEYAPELRRLEDMMKGKKYDKDLLKHFVMSQHLKKKYGAIKSMGIGLGKEVYDMMPGGSGFDFKDLGADFAANVGMSSDTAYNSGMLTRGQ